MQLVTHSALLRALGWSLFNSLWQMALLWLFFTIFIRIFKTLSAHARHGLAVFLLCIGAAWSGLSFLNAWYDSDALSPGLNVIFSNEAFAGYSGWNTIRDWFNKCLPYCSSIYLLFLTFLFARYLHHYIQSRRLRTSGLYKVQGELRIFVRETARRMGIGKEVGVWFSTLVDGPLTLGFLKPVILLPFTTVNNLSIPQVEAILLHELAHIRRNDYLLNLGVAFLETFFFFNPFVRMLIREVKREREHRCDDLVMQFRYEPHTYVSALLSLARSSSNKNQQLALAAAGENDQLLLRRVRRILDQPETADRFRIKTILLFFIPMAIASLIIFCSPDRPAVQLAEFSGTPGSPAASGNQTTNSSDNQWGSPRQNSSSFTGVFYTIKEQASQSQLIDNRFISVQIFAAANLKEIHVTGANSASTCIAICPDRWTKAHRLRPSGNEMKTTEEANGEAMELPVDDGAPDETDPSDGLITNTATTEKREFSINTDQAVTIQPFIIRADNSTPYIPNSSFAYQDRADTIPPRARIIAARQTAIRNVEKAILIMQKDLEMQLQNLRSTAAAQTENSRIQQETQLAQQTIIMEQLKLQKAYLSRQSELEKKMEKTRKKHVIIYI
jgi:beta-lactamase regulating signal transducer with metallopeptidase domain